MDWWEIGRGGGIAQITGEPVVVPDMKLYGGAVPADIVDTLIHAHVANATIAQIEAVLVRDEIPAGMDHGALEAARTARKAVFEAWQGAWGRDPHALELEGVIQFCRFAFQEEE